MADKLGIAYSAFRRYLSEGERGNERYQALAAVAHGGSSPSADAENWQPLRVPDVFEGYLTRLAAADLLTEAQGKHQTRAAADREFEETNEKLGAMRAVLEGEN